MTANRSLPAGVIAIRWLARATSLALLTMVTMFVIGEGPPPLSVYSAAFGVMLAGLLIGLLWDGAGAVVTLTGLVFFYTLNYWASGRWPGGAFPLFFGPVVLLLVSFLLVRRSRGHTIAADVPGGRQ